MSTPGLLEGVIQPYSWGSTEALATLMGAAPTTTPQAELWFGTHPRGPATLLRQGLSPDLSVGEVLSLGEAIAVDPQDELGTQVARQFAGELPFLLKVLAVAKPLSLQAHPNASQAQAGFEAEESQGIRVDAANRSFVDANHKPELVCALEPFTVLCGFREPGATGELLASLDVAGLARAVEWLRVTEAQAASRVHQVLGWLWGLDLQSGVELAQQVAQACAARTAAFGSVVPDAGGGAAQGTFDAELCWAARMAEHHRGDVGVVVALMLNLVTLQAGQALFLEAGRLHCYLQGTAVEIMANSDNVLRGGLTQKHVDTDGLLKVLDYRPSDVALHTPATPSHTFRPPIGEFCLIRMEVSGSLCCVSDGPEIALCTAGQMQVAGWQIRAGQAVWVPASVRDFAVTGEGLLFRATTGDIE